MKTMVETDKFSVPEEMVEANQKAEGIEILAESLIVDSPFKFSSGGSLLGEIKTVRNGIKDALKDKKSEAQKKHKAYCALEQKYTDPLDHAEELLKYKMAEWVTGQQFEEQVAKDNGSNAPSVIPCDNGISVREIWKCEIKDLEKVPRKYLVADTKMLSGLAKSTKGAIEVEGVRFYKTNTIVNG
jgi:NOL1/NOP2/fmu family ribosome biogenesis protein